MPEAPVLTVSRAAANEEGKVFGAGREASREALFCILSARSAILWRAAFEAPPPKEIAWKDRGFLPGLLEIGGAGIRNSPKHYRRSTNNLYCCVRNDAVSI